MSATWLSILLSVLVAPLAAAISVFPGDDWQLIDDAAIGIDGEALDDWIAATFFAADSGCIVRAGYLVRSWGDIEAREGYASAWKPLNALGMFFLVEEGGLDGVDAPIRPWVRRRYAAELIAKDLPITFRQLANQVSGYSYPQRPGAAFAYNDWATSGAAALLDQAAHDHGAGGLYALLDDRLAPLGLQHPVSQFFSASDFARLGWWWANRGRWAGRQILPSRYFDQFVKPGVPADLPLASGSDPNGSYLFGEAGVNSGYPAQGIYGFWWWHNDRDFQETGRRFCDGLPDDSYAAFGYGGKYCIVLPRVRTVVVLNGLGASFRFNDWDGFIDCFTFVDRTPPEVPTRVRIAAVTDQHIAVAWDPASDADGSVAAYRVYRDGACIVETGATRYDDRGARPGVIHQYRVRALNANGYASPFSSVTSARRDGERRISLEIVSDRTLPDRLSVLATPWPWSERLDQGLVVLDGRSRLQDCLLDLVLPADSQQSGDG